MCVYRVHVCVRLYVCIYIYVCVMCTVGVFGCVLKGGVRVCCHMYISVLLGVYFSVYNSSVCSKISV